MLNFPNVIQVSPSSEKTIKILYDNDEIRVFDVKPYIKGSWYGKLESPEIFATVRPAGDTVMWADGQDIAPHELYNNSVLIS